MKTLYDLLEALPDDDADELRAAFRKAARANHPDFNPDNPEASERFRRIVRANAILSDVQQRAQYDRLLVLAMRQQNGPPKRPSRSGTIRRLATDVLASAIVSIMLIGGYFVYMSAERLPLASAQVVEVAKVETAKIDTTKDDAAKNEPAQAVTVKPLEAVEASGEPAVDAKPESVEANHSEVAIAAHTADDPAKPERAEAAPIADGAAAEERASPAEESGPRDVQFYRERGMRAYRSGDLYLALANFDLAIELDPTLPESYIDRGIVFHRLGDLKRAISDVAEAKRIEAVSRTKAPSVTHVP